MRADTRSFYEAAVLRAVADVCAGLDQALDLQRLARRAALSPFHFHRVFHGLVGETPLEMHRRRRLERAAEQLTWGSVPITEIAFRAGYEAYESFIRAFRARYGMAPSEHRSRGWLVASGERVGPGASYEVNVNDPRTTPTDDLRTDLFVPLAG